MPEKRTFFVGGAAFTAALVMSYWLVFTFSFFEDVLPHGGVW